MQTRILFDEVADYMRAQAQAEHQETMLLIAAIILITIVALVLMFLYIPRNEQLLKERREKRDAAAAKDYALENWGDAEQRASDLMREVEKVKAEAEERTSAVIRECNLELSKERKRAEREREKTRLYAKMIDTLKEQIYNFGFGISDEGIAVMRQINEIEDREARATSQEATA